MLNDDSILNLLREGDKDMLVPPLLSPKMDFVFKGVFMNEKHPEIIVSFLNAVLEPKDLIKSVTFLDRTLEREHEQDKLGCLDVLAVTDKGERINIEIQVADEKNMIQRSLYYLARIYSGQLKKNEKYEDLQKAICITLIDFSLFDSTDYQHPFYMINPKNFIKKIQQETKLTEDSKLNELIEMMSEETCLPYLELHFIELEKFHDLEAIDQIKTELDKWLQFINYPESEVVRELTSIHQAIQEAREDLIQLSLDEDMRLLYEKRMKQYLDRKNELYNSHKRGHEKGIKEGIEIGIDIGRQEGIEEGEKKEKIKIAQTALKEDLGVELIASITQLSVEEVLRIKDTLED